MRRAPTASAIFTLTLGAGLLAAWGPAPPPLDPEEALRTAFDRSAAEKALAESAEHWHATYNCVTCHTNGLFLVSGAVDPDLKPAWQRTRSFAREYLQRYLEKNQEPQGQHGAVEGIVATSAFLAIGEARNQGRVSNDTLDALRKAASRVDASGHFTEWLTCDWPPYEVDHHFGTSLLLVALGTTPESFQTDETMAPHIGSMRTWIRENPPVNAHQAGMCLWADATGGLELTEEQRNAYIQWCRRDQHEDGGWSVKSIGGWLRPDGTPQVTDSEAYATAFMIFVLRQAGVAANDDAIKRGLAWLRAHQRESGRWFTRSPRRDRRHYLSNAATNFAILALEACEEPSPPESELVEEDR
ncbi:MAG: hypothetical protein MK085_02095 [Phycisphaerales bacterium]|nr:hypothetical protein [Phycisphaerales bacterium]